MEFVLGTEGVNLWSRMRLSATLFGPVSNLMKQAMGKL